MTFLIFMAGLAAVVFGVALVSTPAAFIAGGSLTAVLAVGYERGGKK